MPQSEAESDVEAFFRAIEVGEAEALGMLLEAQPAVASARNASGVSGLLYACYHRRDDLAELIRGQVQELDVFEAAALGDLPELRRHVTGSPAVCEARSADGFTALHLAAFFGRVAATNLLVGAGSEPDAVAENPSRVCPVHSAVASGSAGALRAVLAAGANPDAKQQGGFTALLAAAKHGHYGMVAALLGHGAQPELASDDGTTPLDFARQGEAPEVVALLERWKARG